MRPKRFCGSEDQRSMCIGCITRRVINQVWLQDHGLACDVDREEAKSCWKDLVQLLGTLLSFEGS